MELAAARARAAPLDVGDDLRGRRALLERRCAAEGRDADLLVGAGEEGVDGGGLGGHRGEGALLGGTSGLGVRGRWDGLGAFSGHDARLGRGAAEDAACVVCLNGDTGEPWMYERLHEVR